MAELINVSISMVRYRCRSCYRYYAVEEGAPVGCPACLIRDLEIQRAKVSVIQRDSDEAFVAHRRQVSALKGAITKAKSR